MHNPLTLRTSELMFVVLEPARCLPEPQRLFFSPPPPPPPPHWMEVGSAIDEEDTAKTQDSEVMELDYTTCRK